jgi:hypothetical protein
MLEAVSGSCEDEELLARSRPRFIAVWSEMWPWLEE